MLKTFSSDAQGTCLEIQHLPFLRADCPVKPTISSAHCAIFLTMVHAPMGKRCVLTEQFCALAVAEYIIIKLKIKGNCEKR